MEARRFLKRIALLAVVSALLAALPTIASAHRLTQASANVNCEGFDVSVSTSGLLPNKTYQILYSFTANCGSHVIAAPGSITFTTTATNTSPTLTQTGAWTLTGTCTVSGDATMTAEELTTTVPIVVTPTTLTCAPPTPGLSLTKTPSKVTVAPGEPVTYTYTVSNTGTMPLSNIVVTDDNGTPNNTKDDITVGTIATLDAGASDSTLTRTVVPSTVAIVPTLGSVGPGSFAVLSLGGDASHRTAGINCSLATVNGNLGIPSYGKFTNAAPCTENGNFFKGLNVNYSGPGKLRGATITNEALMNTLRAEAFNASTFFAGLPATIPASSVNNGNIGTNITLTGTPGFNVVNLTGFRLNGNLTLTGPPGTQFVFNISGNFDLHSGKILASGSVSPTDVVYNITNPSASVKTMVPTTAVGILLAPNNAINAMDSSNFTGEIIGGYNKVITLMSGTKVNQPPSPPPNVTNTATATATANGMTISTTAKATVTIQ